ncbi:MAG: NAD(P)H-dependent oxidoreductase subunit E [Nitrospiraceae bacterium]|nr:NAD(P)H-dependent oxidoreductase subunit E [Nitrospiraceae bacterium]
MKKTCGCLKPADLEKLKELCGRHGKGEGVVIPMLQEIQEVFGYISEDAVNFVADRLEMPRSHFYGVATFYAQFHFRPRGRNIITACSGTACHVKGSENLISILGRELGIPEGQDTYPDMNFTLERVNCVGACSIAPVVIVNKAVHGKMNADKVTKEVIRLKGADDGKKRRED